MMPLLGFFFIAECMVVGLLKYRLHNSWSYDGVNHLMDFVIFLVIVLKKGM